MLDLPNNLFPIFISVYVASVNQIIPIVNSNILVIKLCQIKIPKQLFVIFLLQFI